MKALNPFYFLISGFLVAACASSPPAPRRVASDEKDVQQISGFVLLETNDKLQRFAFRDQGEFLVSKTGFSRRIDAVDFCRAVPGFDLSDWVLPGVMTITSLPFEDVRKNNIVDANVLDGSKTMSGEGRGGLIFWIKGKTVPEEAQISKKPDLVYAMMNGCGPNCQGVEALSAVNAKLKTIGKPALFPVAICTSESLQKNLGQ